MVLSVSIEASDIERGKEKSVACAACHGQQGVSPSPIWPNLAGQHESYLSKQLYEFKKGPSGNRNNSIMYGISLTLSDEDISDLSKYYASLDGTTGRTLSLSLFLSLHIFLPGPKQAREDNN